MIANPEVPPKIDWTYYKAKVPVPGMVDTFQKAYESMQIPYPQDTATPLIDAQDKEVVSIVIETTNNIIVYFKCHDCYT